MIGHQRIRQQIKKCAVNITSSISNIDYANDQNLLALITSQNTNYIVKLQLESNELGPQEILQLSLGTWKSLCKIDLLNNRLGNKGCQFITRAGLNKLKEISLSQNHIGTEGVLHLSKSNWKNLQNIYLGTNNIGLGGTVWLVRSNWKMMSINLNWNKLKAEDMLGLLLAQWNLIYLTLGSEIVKLARRQKVRRLIQLKNKSISLYF